LSSITGDKPQKSKCLKPKISTISLEEAPMPIVKVYNPIGEVYESAQDIGQTSANRPTSLNGKVMGFIDDMKPNAGAFLKFIEGFMKKDYQIPTTHIVRKFLTPNMAIADELDSSVSAVVVAWGD
jgi:hypothetical protein